MTRPDMFMNRKMGLEALRASVIRHEDFVGQPRQTEAPAVCSAWFSGPSLAVVRASNSFAQALFCGIHSSLGEWPRGYLVVAGVRNGAFNLHTFCGQSLVAGASCRWLRSI